MRRALAAALLGISLWLGSLAWTGFVLLRTVLDPERSRDVAEALYEDEAVRAQLAAGIADAVDRSLPPGVPVPRDAVEASAAEALASPAVEAVFVDALTRNHAAFLGEGRPPEAVDAGALGAELRAAVVAGRPQLDAVLPASPQLDVPLPTAHVPDAGPVRDAVAAAVPVLALAAASGASLALLVTSDRPRVVRRAGRWAIGLSAGVLLLAYGVPYVAEALLPAQAAVIAALVRAVAAATRVPALLLAGAGLAAIVASALWRRAPAAVAAEAPARRRRRGGRPAGPPIAPAGRRRHPAPVRPAPAHPAPLRWSATDDPSPAVTRVQPGASPTIVHEAAVPSPPSAHASRGAGRLLPASEGIPPEARWVPGVGYVVDDR